jgi:geranylgeranyl pyrophosphate synthase
LAQGYRDLLDRWTVEHLGGGTLDRAIREYHRYALGDKLLPRPLLMMVGYGACRTRLDGSLAAEIGDLVFLPQVIRDLLAIHDDIVDGDLVKFGQPTLPAAFAALAPSDDPSWAGFGAHVALYWGDLLYGLVGDLIGQVGLEVRDQMWARISALLRRSQRGQLNELMLQREDPIDITADTLLGVYADKAADYCYMTPFDLGAIYGGVDDRRRRAAAQALEFIGVASQIIDDIAGGCPQALDHGRDTLGEILGLRRTLLLCELARALPRDDTLAAVIAGRSATPEQAAHIREAFIASGAVKIAAAHAEKLAERADAAIAEIELAAPATEYLHDLVTVRVRNSLDVVAERVNQQR